MINLSKNKYEIKMRLIYAKPFAVSNANPKTYEKLRIPTAHAKKAL